MKNSLEHHLRGERISDFRPCDHEINSWMNKNDANKKLAQFPYHRYHLKMYYAKKWHIYPSWRWFILTAEGTLKHVYTNISFFSWSFRKWNIYLALEDVYQISYHDYHYTRRSNRNYRNKRFQFPRNLHILKRWELSIRYDTVSFGTARSIDNLYNLYTYWPINFGPYDVIMIKIRKWMLGCHW